MQRIGLALSGGGTRAMAFHAGVLKWMSEEKLLENVEHVSTVSGGSLFAGLIFHISGNKWPNSSEYTRCILPKIREFLTTKSLQCDSLRRLIFYPSNWRYCLSRAQVLSQSIRELWGITASLNDLPQRPMWTINGSTAETGRRFRFKGVTAGDYKLGYAYVPDYPLSSAMAMSAAFPVGIGPLTFRPTEYKWTKKANWDDDEFLEISHIFSKLHLYDGGVYDNLGIEPLYDTGRQQPKRRGGEELITTLIVSDAGAAYDHPRLPHPLNPFRAKVIMDIMQEQTRALRVRSFLNFLQNNDEGGASSVGMYLQIGSDPKDKIQSFVSDSDQKEALSSSHDWLAHNLSVEAASISTTLRKMKADVFDLLVEHGFQTALWNHLVWG